MSDEDKSYHNRRNIPRIDYKVLHTTGERVQRKSSDRCENSENATSLCSSPELNRSVISSATADSPISQLSSQLKRFNFKEDNTDFTANMDEKLKELDSKFASLLWKT